MVALMSTYNPIKPASSREATNSPRRDSSQGVWEKQDKFTSHLSRETRSLGVEENGQLGDCGEEDRAGGDGLARGRTGATWNPATQALHP